MEQVIKTTKKLDEDKELKLEFNENPMLNGYQEVEIKEEEEEEEEEYDDDDEEWEPTDEELKEIEEGLREAEEGLGAPLTEEERLKWFGKI